MKKIINFLLNRSLRNMVYIKLKFGRLIISPFKRSHFNFDNISTVTGDGTLMFGLQWQFGHYLPSQLIMRKNSQLNLHGNFKIFTGINIWINENATLTLGSGYINNNINISCYESVSIGNNVAISENVTIRDSDNHSLNGGITTAPIKIGNNVWVGMNVTILKGVSIEDGAVIAAGSVVNKDVPANTLVAGIPATIKKHNVTWR